MTLQKAAASPDECPIDCKCSFAALDVITGVALLVFGILGLSGVLPMATGQAIAMVVCSPLVMVLGGCMWCLDCPIKSASR